jgi:hypothetical protein
MGLSEDSWSRVAWASGLCALFWVGALLLSAFISLIGYIGTGFAPIWSSLPFLLAFPAALVGLMSFRASAIIMFALLVWNIVATTWPHLSLSRLLDSQIDVFLLASCGMTIVVAVLSPIVSVSGFMHHFQDR